MRGEACSLDLQDHLTEQTSAASYGLVLKVQCLGVLRMGVTG
jgi:hypothetical protein